MKKFIDKLKNIWSIEELRNRIVFTFILVLVYRIGCYITLPGINPKIVEEASKSNTNGGLLGILNMFAGGAFQRGSIFALGVMPYISASIFMQLAGIIVPQVQKLQREESGRRKINQYTRYITVIVTALQSSAYVTYLLSTQPFAGAISPDESHFTFWLSTVVVLTAGTLFVMWMGERITEKGIGNGTSLLIMVGILGRFPAAIREEFLSQTATGAGAGGYIILLVEMVIFVAVVMGLILLTQGTRRIPLNYARQLVSNANTKDLSGSRDFIPLKVNSAGVMPIIFAQAMMFIPTVFRGFATSDGATGFFNAIADNKSATYNIVYCVLVIAFTYFYTALIFNPTEISDNLKRNNSFIPGVKPGEDTANYVATIMDRITLPGAVFLAIAGILPSIASLLHVSNNFSYFYGGTSMLIGVGVILDTLQQVESYLLMNHYDGLMKNGRITGRNATADQATALRGAAPTNSKGISA